MQAIANGDIDESVFAGEGDGGFRAIFCEWEEAGSRAAAHDD